MSVTDGVGETMRIAAAPARVVIDLGADATILEAAARVASTRPDQDVVLVVPSGAPLLRNAAFLDVLKRRADDRRITLVSPDARARSLAASVHLRAFTSIAALERHELDATERLGQARRAALATIAASGASRASSSFARGLAVFACLVGAAAILFAVVAPEATVTVAAAATPIGPYEYDLRAGPSGDIQAETLQQPISRKFMVKATGEKVEETSAKGIVRFTNATTNDIRIAKGTVVQTPEGIKFGTDVEKILPKSTILTLFISEIDIPVTAISPGPRGNVPAGRINQSPSREYLVSNPAPTTGGETKTTPLVKQSDYDAAAAPANQLAQLKIEADAQLARWKAAAPKDVTVYGPPIVKVSSVTPPSEVVNREVEQVELTVTGTAQAYRVASAEPRQTALRRLALEAPAENAIDQGERAEVRPVIPATVGEDGVHWRVSARSIQYRRDAQLAAALAGRSLDDAAAAANARGFSVTDVVLWPAWWPRMPVLDSRITITVGEPIVTASTR
jgi:hypothetical protein